MSRAADYSIQGFLYQFNKTLYELLGAADDDVVTVEGIIEDLEVTGSCGTRLIQCKYHEGEASFAPSAIYDPLLQMIGHFQGHPTEDFEYRLYAYFPDCDAGECRLTEEQIRQVMLSNDKALNRKFGDVLGKNVDAQGFLNRFRFECGKSLDELRKDVCEALSNNNLPKDSIETLIYPNAIQRIAGLSICHNVEDRKITKFQMLAHLREVRKTAITRWTLALTTAKKLMKARQDQLKTGLAINTRTRYFLLSSSALEDFDDGIVTFIDEYLAKYHFKEAHTKVPLFCLDCTEQEFDNICSRVHKKGITYTHGRRGPDFFSEYFFREPMFSPKRGYCTHRWEFQIRLLWFGAGHTVMNEQKCDDLFVVCDKDYPEIDRQDINVEDLAVTKFQELKYLLGVSNVYE